METSKDMLLAEYRRLVRVELPRAAKKGKWTLQLDHCFARVILDGVFGDCWYHRLEHGRGRSAESQLDASQLQRAIGLARAMLARGDAEVQRLNAQSLAWRGKAHPHRGRRVVSAKTQSRLAPSEPCSLTSLL